MCAPGVPEHHLVLSGRPSRARSSPCSCREKGKAACRKCLGRGSRLGGLPYRQRPGNRSDSHRFGCRRRRRVSAERTCRSRSHNRRCWSKRLERGSHRLRQCRRGRSRREPRRCLPRSTPHRRNTRYWRKNLQRRARLYKHPLFGNRPLRQRNRGWCRSRQRRGAGHRQRRSLPRRRCSTNRHRCSTGLSRDSPRSPTARSRFRFPRSRHSQWRRPHRPRHAEPASRTHRRCPTSPGCMRQNPPQVARTLCPRRSPRRQATSL
jgi:hypothetical protein